MVDSRKRVADEAGRRPGWQVLYESLAALRVGEQISHAEISAIVGVPVEARAAIRRFISRAEAELSVRDQRCLAPVRNVGYLVRASPRKGLADDPAVDPGMVQGDAVMRAAGAELADSRRERKIRREVVAHYVRIHDLGVRQLRRIELGEVRVTVGHLMEVCHVLRVDAAVVYRLAIQRATETPGSVMMLVDVEQMRGACESAARSEDDWRRVICDWAEEDLPARDDGILAVTPAAIRAVATCRSIEARVLASYLNGYRPTAARVSRKGWEREAELWTRRQARSDG